MIGKHSTSQATSLPLSFFSLVLEIEPWASSMQDKHSPAGLNWSPSLAVLGRKSALCIPSVSLRTASGAERVSCSPSARLELTEQDVRGFYLGEHPAGDRHDTPTFTSRLILSD